MDSFENKYGLSADAANSIAIVHYDWFAGRVKRWFGPAAEHYAPMAFMRVLKYYNPAEGAFQPFANTAGKFAVQTEFSLDHGRAGSAQRLAEINTASIQAIEEHGSLDDYVRKQKRVKPDPEPEPPPVDMSDLLRQIDGVYRCMQRKAAAVCKVLGIFDDGDTAFILNRNRSRNAFLRSFLR